MRGVDLKWWLVMAGTALAVALTVYFIWSRPSETDFDVPRKYQADVDAARRTGRDIFDHDNAASAATRFMRETGYLDDPRLRGWITARDGDKVLVSWMGDNAGTLAVLYEVAVRGVTPLQDTYVGYGPGKAPTASQLALFKAIEAARRAPYDKCAPAFNPVALTDPGTGDRVVYLLPAGFKAKMAVVGGFVTVRLDPSGERVLSTVQSPKKCRAFPIAENQVGVGLIYEDGETISPFAVWASLFYRLPAHVRTRRNDTSWVVYGDETVGIDRD